MFFKTYTFPLFLVGKIRQDFKKKWRVQKNFWEKLFLKGCFSNVFRTLSEKFSGFCKENLGVFIKTGFSFSKETFGWKCFGELTNCYFFEYRAEKVRLAVRKKSAGLSSCFLPLHGNILKKFFLESFCNFCGLFFGIFPVNEQGKFDRPVKTAFFVSIKTFWRKNCFGKQMKSFIIFWQWAGIFRLLVEFFDEDVKNAFFVTKIKI